MESLHLSSQRVVDVGMFKRINLSPLVNLSHMFYADDAVFVGQWCDGNINTLVYMLECFFQASSLRINMCKSKIMGVNVGDEKVKSAASKLGCLILNTTFSYLGTKVGGNMSRVQAWTEVVDKVKSRLSNWKMKSDQLRLKKQLEEIDLDIDRGLGNEELVNSRLAILHQIQKIDNLESKERAQKAKIKWAVEGDENSGFFHGIINKRRNIQNIRGVMVDGNWIENPNDVKKEFFDHFANRFGKPDKPTASISLDFPNQISHEQSDHMEREVSNDEIKKSVWECGTDKAPGPDGFTFGFFRHFWHLVDRDVCEAVRYFFKFSDLPKGCNSSFIALIPKIPDANLVKDFRPISLIGSIYKIIAKILTNRLVDVLGGIINEVQSAFIKDRQI
ncbi:hypothetical protein Tco_1117475, partial [Tanacetum coccineum]